MNPLPTLPRLLTSLLVLGASLCAAADSVSDALALHRAGKTAEALQQIDRLLAAKPKDPPLRFAKGVMLADSHREAEAITVFTALTQDHPELAEPYNNLAALHAAGGDYDQARVALELSLRANPAYATARENLGDVYAALAGASYARALQLDPANAALPGKIALARQLFAAQPAAAASAPR